jgi:hypothetical protein
MRARLGAVLLVMVAAALPVAPAHARTDNRSKPVIVLHGLDLRVPSAACEWMNGTAPTLRRLGHAGAAIVGYYTTTKCNDTVMGYGSHGTHYPSGHSGTGHTAQADIRHLGYHLAWYIWTRYSASGIPVDIVAHSMGGLVARYALAGTAMHLTGFPPYLLLEDAVTLGTPHRGFVNAGCPTSVLECSQMRPNSTLLAWLAAYAPDPQGRDGSDWTTIASSADEVVPPTSATGMSAPHAAVYTWPRMTHDDLIADRSDASDAVVDYRNGTVNRTAVLAPHIMHWEDRSLVYGGW